MITQKTGHFVFLFLGIITGAGIAYRTFVASMLNVLLKNLGLHPIEPFVNSEILTQLVVLSGMLVAAIGGKQIIDHRETCTFNRYNSFKSFDEDIEDIEVEEKIEEEIEIPKKKITTRRKRKVR